LVNWLLFNGESKKGIQHGRQMIDDELWEKLQGLLPRYCSHELKNRVKIVNLHRYREDREMNAHRRHDLSDQTWVLLELHLLGRAGTWGGKARNNRQFINAVLWIFRTGAPWRDLPSDYGSWSNTHRRFIRWRGNTPQTEVEL